MNPSREELKLRLQQKIKDKRSGQVNKKQVKADPQTTLLGLGIEDPEILKMANVLVKNPQEALKNLKGINTKNE